MPALKLLDIFFLFKFLHAAFFIPTNDFRINIVVRMKLTFPY